MWTLRSVKAIYDVIWNLLKDTGFPASFLAGRSWRGLEAKLGETPVVKAVEGRRGIAIAYEEEGTSWWLDYLFFQPPIKTFKHSERSIKDFV